MNLVTFQARCDQYEDARSHSKGCISTAYKYMTFATATLVPRAIMPCWFPQQSVRRSARYRERAIIPQCAPTSIVDENKHTSPTRSDSSFTFPTCTKKDEVCKSRVTWPTGGSHGHVYEKYGFIASPPPTYDRKQNKFLSRIRSRLVRHGELYLSGLIRVC